MGSVNDCKYNALSAVYGNGHINDLLLKFLQANGATSGSISDAWAEVAGGGVNPLPVNAIADYDFSQFSPESAITDKVTGQKVTTTRAGNLNVVQSDGTTIEAFGFNQAGFDRGVGMLVEKDGKNVIPTNTDLAAWTFRGTDTIGAVDSGVPSPLQGFNWLEVAVARTSAVADFFIAGNYFSPDEVHNPSAFIANPNGITDTLFMSQPTGSQFGQYRIDMTQISAAGEFITKDHPAVTEAVSFIANDVGRGGLVYKLANDENAQTFYIQFPSSDNTSPILTSAVTANRPATIAEIPTIAELGYLIDEPSTATVPCTTSNLNESGWVNGVRNLNFGNLNLNFNLGDIQSKYGAGFVNNASLIGLKVISPQGAVVQATAGSNAAASIGCTIIINNGLTNEQML